MFQAKAVFNSISRVLEEKQLEIPLTRIGKLQVKFEEGARALNTCGVVTSLRLAFGKGEMFTEIHLDDGLDTLIVFTPFIAFSTVNLGQVIQLTVKADKEKQGQEVIHYALTPQILGEVKGIDFIPSEKK